MTEKKVSLWNIAEELEILEREMIEAGGEMTPELEAAQLKAEQALITKTDGIAGFFDKQDDCIEIAKKRIAGLNSYIKIRENSKKRMLDFTINCMKKMEKPELVGVLSTITLKNPTKVVNITNEALINIAYTKTKPAVVSVDKTAIAKALKSGATVDGAELIDGKQSLIFGKRKI